VRVVDRLAVFARYPTLGSVKTRLSPALPPRLATALHAGLVADTLAVALEASHGQVTVFWADAPTGGATFGLLPDGIEERHQRGADLGERLAHAFAGLLASPGDRALIVGTDCPEITPGLLRRAISALERHDVVIGPAADGGYYLIGLARPAPALFERVAWGTASVLMETLERARASGLTTARLEVLNDVDSPADLARLLALLSAGGEPRVPATRAALRAVGLLPAAAAERDAPARR
jgi:rSAM/selenodomain-associated transferase 1